ncbi:MAG: hypothetical protein KGD59_06660 [Candidatus Heimdallarchaeota archaeon]|nr:hypothetical protein [Candidatus Heimdallarchaeota archaeon]MBY8994215.1 hypothetical protein [Candidatus Heimdallarchaeota archaeon]
MSMKKIDVRRKVYSLKQHHTNVLKKVVKMQSKSNTAGVLLGNEINKGGEIMSALFYVFLESIQETNEDKKHFMEKLSMYNEMSKAMGEYLKELNEIAINVNNTNKNDKNYDEATLVDNTIKRLDKMTEAVTSCSSILSSSREERKIESLQKLRELQTNIIQIKNKLKQKKSIETQIHKPSIRKPAVRKPSFPGKKSKESKK